jgi:hypothetical protein
MQEFGGVAGVAGVQEHPTGKRVKIEKKLAAWRRSLL